MRYTLLLLLGLAFVFAGCVDNAPGAGNASVTPTITATPTPFNQSLAEEAALQVAAQVGLDINALEMAEFASRPAGCEACLSHEYNYTVTRGGITSYHSLTVLTKNNEVTSAVLDGFWDVLGGGFVDGKAYCNGPGNTACPEDSECKWDSNDSLRYSLGFGSCIPVCGGYVAPTDDFVAACAAANGSLSINDSGGCIQTPTCTKQTEYDYKKAYYSPVQCGGNPWAAWAQNVSGIDSEAQALRLYYASQHNISIVALSNRTVYEIVCMACSCPRGDEYEATVYARDYGALLALGWNNESAKQSE